MNLTSNLDPKAYTVEEIDGVWWYYSKHGRKCQVGEKHGTHSGAGGYWIGNSEEEAKILASQEKDWDEFKDWYEIAANLSDENFIKGSRKYDSLIRQKDYFQNWLRDELLMRLILKNS